MNKQREVVYGYRNEVLSTETPRDLVTEIIEKVIPANVISYFEGRDENSPDLTELFHWVQGNLPVRITLEEIQQAKSPDNITTLLVEKVKEAYEARTANLPPEILEQEERRMVLAAIDKQWQAHLYNMDALREGVYLRAQGQKDPLVEYKNEAYTLFVELMGNIEQEAFHNLFRSAAAIEAFIRQLQSNPHQLQGAEGDADITPDNIGQSTGAALLPSPEAPTIKLNLPKRRPSFDIANSGRNAPCPCGSGKKFKQCCGQQEEEQPQA